MKQQRDAKRVHGFGKIILFFHSHGVEKFIDIFTIPLRMNTIFIFRAFLSHLIFTKRGYGMHTEHVHSTHTENCYGSDTEGC